MVTVNPNTPKTETQAPVQAPAAVAVQPGILADLDILITEGTIERTVSPFSNGMLFTMHTLKNPERNQVAKEIPNTDLVTASLAENAPKIPTLIYAISCIEMADKKFVFDNDESRVALRILLNKLAAVQIDLLYLEYLNMTNDLIKIIETGVKKN